MNRSELDIVLAEEREIMDHYAPAYDSAMRTNAFVYRLERRRFIAWLVERARASGDLAAQSVLDVGCATGTTLQAMAAAGFGQLTGIDISPNMLQVTRERHVPRTTLIEVAIENATFEPNSFDVIVSLFTVHHLLDPGAFFRLVDNALRPGGCFFLLEYDVSSGVVGDAGDGVRRRAGDRVREVFAWKNRQALESKPDLGPLFNRAHKMLSYDDICNAMPNRSQYDLDQQSHGFVLPALLPVLLERSTLDRGIASVAERLDGWIGRVRPGVFQWITGRRRPEHEALE